MWGYLSEFWDIITSVGDYTIAFFQNIGNAVAGAIGGLFEDLTHHFYDFFYIIRWFLANLSNMLSKAFTPLIFVFNFIKGFFIASTSTLEKLNIQITEMNLLTENVKAFFDVFPYFKLLSMGIGGALGIFIVIFIAKKVIHI